MSNSIAIRRATIAVNGYFPLIKRQTFSMTFISVSLFLSKRSILLEISVESYSSASLFISMPLALKAAISSHEYEGIRQTISLKFSSRVFHSATHIVFVFSKSSSCGFGIVNFSSTSIFNCLIFSSALSLSSAFFKRE